MLDPQEAIFADFSENIMILQFSDIVIPRYAPSQTENHPVSHLVNPLSNHLEDGMLGVRGGVIIHKGFPDLFDNPKTFIYFSK